MQWMLVSFHKDVFSSNSTTFNQSYCSMSKFHLNWQIKWDGVLYQRHGMPLNRFISGHLYGEKTYSSFGLVSFSLPPGTFNKPMENLIKVVSRHFNHSFYFAIHSHLMLSSILTSTNRSFHFALLIKLADCYFSFVCVFCCCPITFFSLPLFATLFPSHTCLSFCVHTLKTLFKKAQALTS